MKFKLHFGLRRRIGAGFWFGVACLVLGVLFYFNAKSNEDARDWEPLDLPVSLNQGRIETPELAGDLDGNYQVVLQFDRKLSVNKMGCMLGALMPNGTRPPWCKGVPNLIDISWVVYEGDSIVANGDAAPYPGGVWSAKVERNIGGFDARKGRRYRLDLTVKRDASELNATNPHLVIRVPQDEGEGWGVLVAVQKLAARIFAAIGGIVILGRLFIFEFRTKEKTP